MAIAPGSGAKIRPIFNQYFGVDSVEILDGGSGYNPDLPPLLRITGAGVPTAEAKLRPVIKEGQIIRVEVIDPGYGYDPLRVEINGTNPPGLGEGNASGAVGKVFLKKDLNGNDTDEVEYIQLTSQGDSYFGPTSAIIRGGGGIGAQAVAVTGFVTGLSIINPGREYLSNNTSIDISGGGGAGAQGVLNVDETGVVTNIYIDNPGEFYETDPLVLLVGGGGSGAKARAKTNLGELSEIEIINGGGKYTSAPEVVFARKTKLARKVRNRQSYNSTVKSITGLIKDVQPSDTTIFLESTSAFPGSGTVFLNKEIINYTGKTARSLTGCNRGINFRYDQKLILDDGANDEFGISQYKFQVTDRVNRTTPNASNKIAKVYDWVPETRALYIKFEIDELSFIDGGRANEKSNVIAFSGGISGSATTQPHRIAESFGEFITLLSEPIGLLQDFVFEDRYIGEVTQSSTEFPSGDGFADIYNEETAYEGERDLNGGVSSTLYGIEENVGGSNTTLFTAGEVIRDATQPPLEPSVVEVTGLTDGEKHECVIKLTVDPNNSTPFISGNIATGQTTGIQSTTIYYRSLVNGLWVTSGTMTSLTRFVTVANTIDLEEGMLVVGDVIETGTVIAKIINSTTIQLSKPVNPIIGSTTRTITIRIENEPPELDDDPSYTETKNILYLKSPVFVDTPIEYQFGEIIIGAGGGNADILDIQYFSLIRDETLG
jgi:hypothetical protein